MPLSSFHPAVARWWAERFLDPATGVVSEPTSAQARGWAAIQAGGHTLIAAPTGSGKTLAAFLCALDDLLREGLERGLPDETRVVYVSPLKALSTDIHRNLAEPRRGIRRVAEAMGLPPVRITAAVRTGDTPQAERAAMLRTPPHILVTTPESLFLLLTAERSREMLRTARTVIVDEIHAVLESRRGAHLALSLERLDHVCARRLQRIGLSATQKPIERVAEFLVGHYEKAEAKAQAKAKEPLSENLSLSLRLSLDLAVPPCSEHCAIIDEGHLRKMDLALELPGSPLEAVMSAETWQEVYDRLAALIEQHRTTLVFVNTRRLAERLAKSLGERLGDGAVTAHHGSLAREVRLDAEERLKSGTLRALVATASLELGIDIGHVDLVCQIGSPRRIAALLQRVGRSGHTIRGTPKGRLFPLTRDDLIECAALLAAARAGELDRAVIPDRPLDVLAQQIVAETACEDWAEDELFDLLRGAWPYRSLERREFDDVVAMLARGFATQRGRRAALVHYDAVNRRVRGRRSARLSALTSGGAIPEIADFRVVLEPEGTFIGTLNEDFAIESMAGDIIQLGNASWRILRVESGVVRVADARGQPPTIPFWLGEAPARSDELSEGVSRLRERVAGWLEEAEARPRKAAHEASPPARPKFAAAAHVPPRGDRRTTAEARLIDELGVPPSVAAQIVHYLAETKRLLGVVPTQRTLVLERFFDEAGGMQLVLHAPFGARVNRAWGLALRKKFCRKFNFELQAAATDDGLLLSLGPQHSFPLAEVFHYLSAETLEHTLVQAVLDAPLFGTRWRWATTLSLAVLRSRGGRKVPPQVQRMQAEDLLAAAFPDAAACFENIEGEREVPDHPLVTQALRDCLEEAMDLPRLNAIVRDVLGGRLELVARDTPEPSPLAHELLNARPYAFLDDAPLEERRTQAVYTRRALEPSSARDLGALDADAIERVRREAWPEADDADELHDALLTTGFLLEAEAEGAWVAPFGQLCADGRAARVVVHCDEDGMAARDAGQSHVRGSPPRAGDGAQARGMLVLWTAAERLPELQALHPAALVDWPVSAPSARGKEWTRDDELPSAPGTEWTREDALRELLRGRMEVLGPVTERALARQCGVPAGDIELALLALEAQGVVLRGAFTPALHEREWCDRRLLARIHRYTLNRLRAEIEPVSTADFMRFLFRWQHLEPGHRVAGAEGLAAVLEQLDGYELAAGAWERDVLAARVERYTPELLDGLCLSGRVSWGRVSPADGRSGPPRLTRSSPLALFRRANGPVWLAPAAGDGVPLSREAGAVRAALARCGASFADELAAECGLTSAEVERALGELAAAGVVTSDGIGGLRALLAPGRGRGSDGTRSRRRGGNHALEAAGRWVLLAAGASRGVREDDGSSDRAGREHRERVESCARVLLRRYGVVFRRLLAREPNMPPWRELVREFRRMEARGDLRGGRFVAGVTGEQFALPDAVPALRALRREPRTGTILAISAADPANLAGIVTPGERVPALASNRLLFRDGVPIAALEKRAIRFLHHAADLDERTVRAALARRALSDATRRAFTDRIGHRPRRRSAKAGVSP